MKKCHHRNLAAASLLSFLSFPSFLEASTPAFPTAEGAGSQASGGRGGSVFIVTNTNKDGPGSLADAVSAPNRIIVFAISGIIDLTEVTESKPKGGKLIISQPNLTIAGQTAPGEGICIKSGALVVNAFNVVVRHLRVRRSSSPPPTPT